MSAGRLKALPELVAKFDLIFPWQYCFMSFNEKVRFTVVLQYQNIKIYIQYIIYTVYIYIFALAWKAVEIS